MGRIQQSSRRNLLIALLPAIAAGVLIAGRVRQPDLTAGSAAALRKPSGYPQLVSAEPIPGMDGEMCEWVPASFAAGFPQEGGGAAASRGASVDADREPIRTIRDNYPTYSAVAVDVNSNEVYLQDENLFGIKVFDRTANTPPTASFTEPKRVLGGIDTKLEFNCAIYIDPNNGDLYSVNNDTVDRMVVFPRDARGNVKPMRELHSPHRTYGIAVDEGAQELFLTVQHPPQVVVYHKTASGEDEPIRTLEGDRTKLEDAHGIALDTRNGWIFVSNHGSSSSPRIKGGWFNPPSISVYPIKASGDTAPLRIIAGPKTQLNWPGHIFVDAEHGELVVANDSDDSILVFRETDQGDVAPARVIKGPKTGLKNPTGLFVDTKNNELFVSNMGNHSATVYPRTASGDVAPLRTIRSAPLGKQAQIMGNPGAVAYDSKREEILVPN
jgi:6-phosphogluconolactonase (cycloisomerase 2 family)